MLAQAGPGIQLRRAALECLCALSLPGVNLVVERLHDSRVWLLRAALDSVRLSACCSVPEEASE